MLDYPGRRDRPEIRPVRYGPDIPDAHDEIAKMLTWFSLLGVAVDDRLERSENFLFADVLAMETVHPRTGEICPQVQVVLSQGLADETDLGQIRPSAAVRAAGHADHDLVVGQPRFSQHSSSFVIKAGR